MSFKLPEITYPLTIDTIGKALAMGMEMHIHCHTHLCGHKGRVNLVALGHRIGFEHACLDKDLRRYFYCPKCRAAGRPDRDFSFKCDVLTARHSDWPRSKSQ